MPAFLSRTLVLPEELLVAAFTAYQKEKPFECRPIYGLGPQVRHVVLAGYVLRRESEVVQGSFSASVITERDGNSQFGGFFSIGIDGNEICTVR